MYSSGCPANQSCAASLPEQAAVAVAIAAPRGSQRAAGGSVGEGNIQLPMVRAWADKQSTHLCTCYFDSAEVRASR